MAQHAKQVAFQTRYSPHSHFYSESGSKYRPKYSPRYDENGVRTIEQVGEVNQFENIQSHEESCLIENIVKRYQMGETDVLNKVKGFYADATQMPKTYAEFMNQMIETQEFFASLPADVRSKFNNSFEQFLASVNVGDLFDTLANPKSSDEVISDDQDESELDL